MVELAGEERRLPLSWTSLAPVDPYRLLLKPPVLRMSPGTVEEVTFSLLPTSVLFRAGHRIRIAIGGADADTFARVPPVGDPVYTFERRPSAASHIVLPTIPR